MKELLFILLISLLLIHEMDAIRAKEWKLFAVLKHMKDETAYIVFTLAHLPLYIAVIWIMTQGSPPLNAILCYAVDLFLIGHAIVHWAFKNKPANGFTSVFSRLIIYSMGALAVLHMGLLLFGI